MRCKKHLLLSMTAGWLVTALSTPASALCSASDGWYVEGNLGSTYLSNRHYPGSSNSSGIGGNANLGYKFMPFFAMEAGGTQYANTYIKNHAGTKAALDRHYSYDIAGKGIVPITDSGFELFAKLGAERINSHISIKNQAAANDIGIGASHHSQTGLYFGVGAQYYFMPEMAVVAQWMRATGNSKTGTMDLLSLGLSFIFN